MAAEFREEYRESGYSVGRCQPVAVAYRRFALGYGVKILPPDPNQLTLSM
jgi:hypothetical protein